MVSCGTQTPNDFIDSNLILINGGTFILGDIWGDDDPNDSPTSVVSLGNYYISNHEVTIGEYLVFMNDVNISNDGYIKGNKIIDLGDFDCSVSKNFTGFNFKSNKFFDSDSCPITEITWFGALEYCNWLSENNGLEQVYIIDSNTVIFDKMKSGYRLPTEAEWEYAARSGGREDQQWSGTNSNEYLDNYAWYYSNSGNKAYPIKSKNPNAFGLYDMSGNVWEWCWDWYGDYDISNKTNPIGPISGSRRVIRGGYWYATSIGCKTSFRTHSNPQGGTGSIGFRIAQNAE